MKRFVGVAFSVLILGDCVCSADRRRFAHPGQWLRLENQNQRVEYRWKAGDEPPAWAKSAMNAAAADSNSSRRAKAAVFSYDVGGPAWLAYTDDLPTNWAIGYTISQHSRLVHAAH